MSDPNQRPVRRSSRRNPPEFYSGDAPRRPSSRRPNSGSAGANWSTGPNRSAGPSGSNRSTGLSGQNRATGPQSSSRRSPYGDYDNRGEFYQSPERPQASRQAPRRKKKSKAPVVLFFLTIAVLVAVIFSVVYKLPQQLVAFPTQTSASQTSAGGTAGTETPGTQSLVLVNDPAKPLSGKVILLDPGHGGTDSGCIYPASDPKYIEADINLRFAEATKKALEAKGATVILLRSDDIWLSLYSRLALAHLYSLEYAQKQNVGNVSATDRTRLIGELQNIITINSDTVSSGGMGIMAGTGVGSELEILMNLEKQIPQMLYVSIHVNSNDASSLHGTQVYYVTDDSVITSEKRLVQEDTSYQNNPNFPLRADYLGRDGERNKRLAQSLYDAIVASEPRLDGNTTPIVADNYAVLREHGLAGVLIEVGFITNAKDRTLLSDDNVASGVAAGIADGCIQFFSQTA